MKRIILTALLAMSLLAVVERSAKATDVGYGRKFGLGIVIGDPTGLTAKWWIAQTNALDFGLGFWGYGFNNRCFNNGTCDGYGYRGGTFNTDYLWQSNIIRSQAQLDWHVGLGGRAVWVNNCAGDCVGISALAHRPRLDVQQPQLSRSVLRDSTILHPRPRLLVRDRRRHRRPLLLLDRGTSLASLALVPRAPGSLRAGKATLRSPNRRGALLRFVVGLELVGVDLARALAGARRDLVRNAAQLFRWNRHRHRLAIAHARRRVRDAALAPRLPLSERPIQLFVRDHDRSLTPPEPSGPSLNE